MVGGRERTSTHQIIQDYPIVASSSKYSRTCCKSVEPRKYLLQHIGCDLAPCFTWSRSFRKSPSPAPSAPVAASDFLARSLSAKDVPFWCRRSFLCCRDAPHRWPVVGWKPDGLAESEPGATSGVRPPLLRWSLWPLGGGADPAPATRSTLSIEREKNERGAGESGNAKKYSCSLLLSVYTLPHVCEGHKRQGKRTTPEGKLTVFHLVRGLRRAPKSHNHKIVHMVHSLRGPYGP